jgi:hypothetical protein
MPTKKPMGQFVGQDSAMDSQTVAREIAQAEHEQRAPHGNRHRGGQGHHDQEVDFHAAHRDAAGLRHLQTACLPATSTVMATARRAMARWG